MNNLKKARTEIGLTQKQVAERVGIAESQYQMYERERKTPNVYTALFLAKALNTMVENLYPLNNQD